MHNMKAHKKYGTDLYQTQNSSEFFVISNILKK